MMELLDAAIAFALTLAALATVVTVLMEIAHRCVLMRKKNLVQVMGLLNEELPKGTLGLDESKRWEFFTKVVENPAQALSEHIPATLDDGESAGDALNRLDWRCLRSGVYDKVSTEHVLRRLAELPQVQQLAAQAADKLKTEFCRLARKYEEFGSAVSASFKRRSQFWSIVLGVGLAVVANVDGVRMFQAFQAKPALTQNVMARQEQFQQAYGQVESRKRAILDQQMKVTAAQSALAEAQAKQPPDASQVAQAGKNLQVHESKLTALSNPEEIRRLAQETQSQVADLIALGVPVGSAYFPHCRLFGDDAASTTCTGPLWPSGDVQGLWAKRFQFLGHVLLWLIPVVITGVMIGLGAPFWFDVAKRLADVRQMFGGTASDETRLAARDANGDPEKRDAIVARVVDDAAGLTPAPRRRLVP
jgi:hypothetical protein